MASDSVTEPHPTIAARRLSLQEGLNEMTRYFATGGNVWWSHLLMQLSTSFPAGESFFIQSVRKYRGEVTDPTLRREVAGFIGQEAMHTREHESFNKRLDELGYPATKLEGWTHRDLGNITKWTSSETQLAYTIAFEHVTAVLAEIILTDPETRKALGDGVVSDLYTWHALEELEHKSVAFDVYRAAGLSERKRIRLMRWVRIEMTVGLFVVIPLSILFDRNPARRGRVWKDFREFRRSRLVNRETIRSIKAAQRVGFHPTDHDTTALVTEWTERLFGTDGVMNDQLTRAAS